MNLIQLSNGDLFFLSLPSASTNCVFNCMNSELRAGCQNLGQAVLIWGRESELMAGCPNLGQAVLIWGRVSEFVIWVSEFKACYPSPS